MRLVSISFAVLALSPAAFAGSVSDDFNRPNGTNMGPDWVEDYGDTAIQNNFGKGNSGAFTKGFMHHATFTGAFADSVSAVDFRTTGSGQAIVLMPGLNPNSWGCVSIKLQDNDGDSKLDRLFFEPAFNAGTWGGTGPSFFDIAVPTSSGRMSVSFANAGDTVVVEIENSTSGQTETFVNGGILSLPFPIDGSHFGLGHMGPMLFDNWNVTVDDKSYGDGCPGSGGFVPVLSAPLDPVAGQPFSLVINEGLGGAQALLMFGLTQTSVPFGFGSCELLIDNLVGPPVFFPLGGVGPGNGSIILSGTLPASASGVTITTQGFVQDAGAPDGFTATNGLLCNIL